MRAARVAALVLAAFAVFSALGDLTRQEAVMQDLQELGYPAYVATILGAAKLAGAVALVLPGLPRVKEWAYAGFTFDFAGAVASSVLAAQVDADTAVAVGALVLTAVSYLFHRRATAGGAAVGASPSREPALAG